MCRTRHRKNTLFREEMVWLQDTSSSRRWVGAERFWSPRNHSISKTSYFTINRQATSPPKPNLLADHMGVLRKKKTNKGRPAAPPQADRLTGSKMSLTPSLESASLDLEDDGGEEDGYRVNLHPNSRSLSSV